MEFDMDNDMEVDLESTEQPVAKRQKLTNGHTKPRDSAGTSSRLFSPYRTIGLVSPTQVPFTSRMLGKTTFHITTCVGRSLQTYDLRKGLNLVFITRPQTPKAITASAECKGKVLAAFGGGQHFGNPGLWVFGRGKKETELEWPAQDCRESIKILCVFGSWIVGVCETRLLVWQSDSYELWTTLYGASPVPLTQCITSLPTFLNKILVGRQDGSAEIWNVSSGKLVYTILPPSTSYGAITAITPTPALSLVAIAFANGPLLIHDIHTDQTLIQLSSPATIPVTSISFRTDGLGAGEDGQSAGVMATASLLSGDITLWDLNAGGRRTGVLRSAHAHPNTPQTSSGGGGGVSKIAFLPGHAILVSTGLDNTLKTWIFDSTPFSPIPRPLHQRSGHGASVTLLQFLPSASDGSDDTGKWLLSGSLDRALWGWSLRRDGQSTELSQGAVQSKAKKQGLLSNNGSGRDSVQDLKCPPITAVACSLNRDGGIGALPGKHAIWQLAGSKSKPKHTVDAELAAMTGWESVVTAHEGDSKARTWFWGRKRAGRWALPTSDGGNVASVAMSACGTFAVVGSAKGGVEAWNLQSGIRRVRFPPRLTPAQAKTLKGELQMHGLTEDDEDAEGGGNGAGVGSGGKGKEKLLRGKGQHTTAVIGLAVDALNKTLISAGADGQVKFWDFATGLLHHELDWAAALSSSSSMAVGLVAMRYLRSSNLAALACEDGSVRVLDRATRRLIRELWPSRPLPKALMPAPKIGDLCFSTDGRWIAAAISSTNTPAATVARREAGADADTADVPALVSLILVWDLPTGHLIDAFKLSAECKTLAFSPTGEFLATATVDGVGVDIWSNRTLFTHVPTRHITHEDLAQILEGDSTESPAASGDGSAALIPIITADKAVAEPNDEDDLALPLASSDGQEGPLDGLSSDLLSLSLVPRPRWQNLLHLDLIRARNRPVEPPQKPAQAPFFLPSLQDQAPSTSTTAVSTNKSIVTLPAEDNMPNNQGTHILPSGLGSNHHGRTDSLPALLHAKTIAPGAETQSKVVQHLKTLPPAATDLAIRSLATEEEMSAFVGVLTGLLRARRDFELGQAWMAVFLRIHGEILGASRGSEGESVVGLREAVQEWSLALRGERSRVGGLLGYCRGVGGWVGAGRV